MIPSNIRRADELKYKQELLRATQNAQCHCNHTHTSVPPPAYQAPAPKSTPKQIYSTSAASESKFGHCRAVRKGPLVFVSGITAADASGASAQATRAMVEGVRAVTALGGGARDVTRVRLFVSSPEHTDEVGTAFRTMFGKDQEQMGCAMTMVVGQGTFADKPGALVEIEMDAVVDS